MIQNFDEFCRRLQADGFSMMGGNAKGIHTVLDFDWTAGDVPGTPVRWFCENAELDPWLWRMRVLEERDDTAYAKVFFRTGGYITRGWYPDFYAVRRRGETFEETYERGVISTEARRIYEIVSEGPTALHDLKTLGGFGKSEKSRFDRAILDLQMGLFITVSGQQQKRNQYGMEYGWSSTVFSTAEDFWAERGLELCDLDPDESYDRIRSRIRTLNPAAEEKTIRRFILG